MKKMAEVRKAGLTKAEAKLNDEQQKTWKELLGAPFTISHRAPSEQLIRIVLVPLDRRRDEPASEPGHEIGGISDHRAGDLARFRLRMKTPVDGRRSSQPISQ